MKKQPPHISPQARQEASEWFVAFREGDADFATRESFYTWLRRSPENVHAYLRITALWEDAELLGTSDLFDREALLKHARNETNVISLEVPAEFPVILACPESSETNPAQRSSPDFPLPITVPASQHPGLIKLVSIAATLLLLIGVASAWFVTHQNTYATDIGEQRTITLQDGSVIVLNARSRLRVNLTDNERKIDLLEGQAIFRVAHNPTRPFIVHTATASIRAVGTQFDVYRKENGTTVTVLEGRVAISSAEASGRPKYSTDAQRPQSAHEQKSGHGPDIREQPGSAHAPNENTKTLPHSLSALEERVAKPGEVSLAAGEQVTVTLAGALQLQQQANIAAATAWTQGKLVFNETPLSEVVQEFNRYSPRRLVIDDPELQAFHISGVFPSSDPSRIAELLRQRFGVTIHESDDELRIARQ